MEKLVTWWWPGNVRELRNTLQAAHSTATGRGSAVVEPMDLSLPEPPAPSRTSVGSPEELKTQLEHALVAAKGNVSEVARSLAMRRPTVYEKLRQFGIDPSKYRS